MASKPPEEGKPYSNILPGVVAAFLGACLVVACERAEVPGPTAQDAARNAPQAAVPAGAEAGANAATATPQPERALPARDAIDDTVITGRIKTAMLADPGMAGADVSVNTDRGVVSLAGTVKTYEQTGIASAHAQRQDGVVRVDNHLAMNPQ